ncbi:MAG: alpha/beta hydrolase [Erysipelotrichales bacterium]|nr:alpha/beta hydrolase [Erysipelotrichales bacterium]
MIWIIAGILILAVVFYFAHKLSLGFIGREEPAENPLPNPNDDWYEYMQDYYASKKHMADAPHEDLEILSEDGLRLRGRLYRIKPDNHKVVIGFHGYRGSAEADIGRFMKMYEHAGYDCLAISERAHNDSEGKYVTFGVRESKDGILWVKEILRLYGNDVILLIHGVSMGGATVLMMSGNPSLPSQVKAVISDCAYDTLTKEAGSALTQYSPFMQKIVLGILNINAKIFAGYSLKEASPVAAIKNAKIPCLFVHGDLDNFVPRPMMDILYNAYPADKDTFTVKNAVHACAFSKDPEGYEKKFMSFLNKHKLLE